MLPVVTLDSCKFEIYIFLVSLPLLLEVYCCYHYHSTIMTTCRVEGTLSNNLKSTSSVNIMVQDDDTNPLAGLRAPQAAREAINKVALWTGTFSSRGHSSFWSWCAEDNIVDRNFQVIFWKIDLTVSLFCRYWGLCRNPCKLTSSCKSF